MPESRYQIDATTGRITPASHCPSPNHDERPAGVGAQLIVVHSISLPPGEYGDDSVIEFFQNRLNTAAHPYFSQIDGLRVSAHLLIRRDGALVQFVSLNKRAWHAGESSYCGRSQCNDFSVGIELEGTDDTEFTASQYEVLNGVISALRREYPSLADAPVVGHSDISPGRKTDPGSGFRWSAIDARNGDKA